ncbi:hypothetical protein PAHAL_3G122000 [Panicum hallii]|uniref:Uncharacterized protein n=1 Tax=Panicum hallii TaxID=206008 RepID=A0A2T8KHX5_9POAL|nr:hypothetical protein PAHAL_3G122000 [Panicum hallii]
MSSSPSQGDAMPRSVARDRQKNSSSSQRDHCTPEILCVKVSDNAWRRLERRRQKMDSPFLTFYVNFVAGLSP